MSALSPTSSNGVQPLEPYDLVGKDIPSLKRLKTEIQWQEESRHETYEFILLRQLHWNHFTLQGIVVKTVNFFEKWTFLKLIFTPITNSTWYTQALDKQKSFQDDLNAVDKEIKILQSNIRLIDKELK